MRTALIIALLAIGMAVAAALALVLSPLLAVVYAFAVNEAWFDGQFAQLRLEIAKAMEGKEVQNA